MIPSGRATLAAEIVGSGAPVVFLHANICDRRRWRAQVDAVSATNTAIAYDRRGFGETRAEKENFSSVADLMVVLEATTNGTPAILVGCSAGGRLALDAALQHPSSVRALFLISPTVTGVANPTYPVELNELQAAELSGDLDRVNAMKARLFLDGPLASEGRVAGAARALFLDMHAIALRSPPVGSDLDVAPNFPRLSGISAPARVICGDFEFPHIQERCRQIAPMMPNGSHRALAGAAHLASLDRPAEITSLLAAFIDELKA